VAYSIHLNQPEIDYLAALPLSKEAKAGLEDFVFGFLSTVPDSFLLEPSRHRIASQSIAYVDFLLLDLDGDGLVHRFDFHVNHGHMAHGVLVVDYVEHFS
jgi:hypothetical protein